MRIRWLEGLLVEVLEEARREAERALALVDPGSLRARGVWELQPSTPARGSSS